MTGNEVMVFMVFLLLGYWIVSAFLHRTPKGKAQDLQPEIQTWHRVLNVNANASVEEIQAAYQRLISENHPYERKSGEITAAYQEAMRSRAAS
jgi:DnaJ-domain-containing protein 1